MKHKDTEKEPIHSLIIIFTKGRSLDQAVTSAITTTTAGLVVSQDIANYCVETDILANGGGHHVRIVDEFFKIFPCFTFWEDSMQSPEVMPGQSLHHGEGDGSALMDSMTDDFLDMVRDILQVSSDGVAPGFHSSGRCSMEGLNQRF